MSTINTKQNYYTLKKLELRLRKQKQRSFTIERKRAKQRKAAQYELAF